MFVYTNSKRVSGQCLYTVHSERVSGQCLYTVHSDSSFHFYYLKHGSRGSIHNNVFM